MYVLNNYSVKIQHKTPYSVVFTIEWLVDIWLLISLHMRSGEAEELCVRIAMIYFIAIASIKVGPD